MTNALIPRRGLLPQRLVAQRAAQYVRMSTDRQQYSIPNQMAAIALYAAEHQLTIVRTYVDEAISGLKLSNRPGLVELLGDVQSGNSDFASVLVFDVSRWGRFQDTDESAYYEFICKKAKIKVVYCAEVFENDDSPMSGIFKNLKRLMAAEYSRELSGKVFAGQSRVARSGFWVGGQPSFALRRELVDEKVSSKGLLEFGQRKWLHTDRVVLRPGPADEIATLRWIFETFVKDRKNETRIARDLNARGVRNHLGTTWDPQMVGRILRNEAYIGNTLYARTSNQLTRGRITNPKAHWIRGKGALDQIVPTCHFDEAQRILESRVQKLSSEELLKKLRVLQRRGGHLSRSIIDNASGLPKAHVYERRFGSLREAYALIGYTTEIDCSYLEARTARTTLIRELADEIVARVPGINPDLIAEPAGGCLKLNSQFFLSFRVARCWLHSQRKCATWTLRRGANPRPGFVVVIRMNQENKRPIDYLVIPMSQLSEHPEIANEERLINQYRCRPDSIAGLVRALRRRLP